MGTKKNAMAACAILLCATWMAPLQAQRKPGNAPPILEARDISGGCCDRNYNLTYLRVFADGKAEWDNLEPQNWSVAHHEGRLSKKKLKAVQRAVNSMRGLKDFYAGKSSENNIDSWFHLEITGRQRNRTFHMDIAFAFPVNGENYAELPDSVRTVVCNIAITHSELAMEKMDLEMCRRYYVGW